MVNFMLCIFYHNWVKKILFRQKYTLKLTEEDTSGKILHVHELEELMLLKCSYYDNQYTDSM